MKCLLYSIWAFSGFLLGIVGVLRGIMDNVWFLISGVANFVQHLPTVTGLE